MKQGSTCPRAASWVLVCTLIASPALFAQVYTWTDENGVTHFSQLPPPGGQAATVEDVPEFTPPDSADTDAGFADEDMSQGPEGSGQAATDSTLSAADLKRAELAKQREQWRADQDAQQSACDLARQRLAQLEPSRRVFYTNERGETVRWDDEERVATIQQLHDFLDQDCQ